MGFLFPQRRISGADAGIPTRRGSSSGGQVSTVAAMRTSAVWAALRLRASLESTLPVDCYTRYTGSGLQVPTTVPEVLVTPDTWGEGQPMDIVEWLYATRLDLDRYGNAFGIITARDGNGLPREIHLVAAEDVSVVGKGSRIDEYRVKNKSYNPAEIWHERQYTEAGSPLGLSPIAFAARTISTYASALQFTLDWFDRGATPSMIMRSTTRELNATDAALVQRRVAASMQNGEPAVVGKEWAIDVQGARAKDVGFLDLMDHTVVDVARFFDVPADMIDGAVSGQSITYANISQRNLQFLIMHFGPAIVRREKALSRVVPGRGFVKLNTDGLLRLDPDTRRKLLILEVGAGLKTVNEARELENLPPLEMGESGLSEDDRASNIARILQQGYLAVGKGITSDELRALANRIGAGLPVPGPDFTPNEGAP